MSEETYNGWTNYATWRVMLETFDGRDVAEDYGTKPETYELAQVLREEVEEIIDQECTNPYVRGWADAFVSEANWDEIAEHLIDDAEWDDDEEDEEE